MLTSPNRRVSYTDTARKSKETKKKRGYLSNVNKFNSLFNDGLKRTIIEILGR